MRNKLVATAVIILLIAAVVVLCSKENTDIHSFNDNWIADVGAHKINASIPLPDDLTSQKQPYFIYKEIEQTHLYKSIAFITAYTSINAYVDGQLVHSFGAINEPFKMPLGREIIIIPIEQEYLGKTLTLEITSYVNAKIQNIYLGKKTELLLAIITSTIPLFITAIVMAFLSIILLFVTRGKNFDAMILSALYLLCSCYILVDVFLFNPIMPKNVLALIYISINYLMHLLILLYGYRNCKNDILKKAMKIILYICAIQYALFAFGRILIQNFNPLLGRMNQYLSIIYLLVVLIVIIKKPDKRQSNQMIGFMILCIALALDLLKIKFLMPSFILFDFYYFKISLLIFVVLHIWEMVEEYISNFIQLKSQLAIEQSQSRIYKEKVKASYEHIQNIREIKHDIASHLNIIRHYADKNQNKSLISYVDELTKGNNANKEIEICDNILLSAIINHTVMRTKQLKIDFEYKVRVEENMNISENDLCSFLSNILDNAIEGSLRAKAKKIYLNINTKNNHLSVHCTNSCETPVIIENDKIITSKKDKGNHGIGFVIMRKIVNKYNGFMDIDFSGNEFVIKAALKIR